MRWTGRSPSKWKGEIKEVHEFIDAVVEELRSFIREMDESSDQREAIFGGFRIG